jgi:hypothetical protein
MKNMTENFDVDGSELDRPDSEEECMQKIQDIYESSIIAQRTSLTAKFEEMIDNELLDRKSLDREFGMDKNKNFSMSMRNFISNCFENALQHMIKDTAANVSPLRGGLDV